MKDWNRWHYFPDAGPDGPNPLPNETHPDAATPGAGDEITIECKDPITLVPKAPLQYFDVQYDIQNPHNGIPQYLQILRWKHRNQDTASRWQEVQDEMESRYS
jgi:hypothetical protein